MNLHYPGQTTLTSMVPKILGAIPDNDQYWEFFCGTCEIFKRKTPVPSFLIDKNNDIVNRSLEGFTSLCSHTYLHKDVFDVLDEIIKTGAYAGAAVSENAFMYMDPPWRISKLGKKKPLYDHSLTDNETAKLLLLARKLKYKTAILHYVDEMYDDILNDWYRLDMKVSFRGRVCNIGLYCNFDFRSVQLQMTAFPGKDRTDRQRIKRKAKRWVEIIGALPAYERQIIIESILEKYSG